MRRGNLARNILNTHIDFTMCFSTRVFNSGTYVLLLFFVLCVWGVSTLLNVFEGQVTNCKFCFSTINPQLNLLRFICNCGESLFKDIMTQIPSWNFCHKLTCNHHHHRQQFFEQRDFPNFNSTSFDRMNITKNMYVPRASYCTFHIINYPDKIHRITRISKLNIRKL